jgi:hypothetical protein
VRNAPDFWRRSVATSASEICGPNDSISIAISSDLRSGSGRFRRRIFDNFPSGNNCLKVCAPALTRSNCWQRLAAERSELTRSPLVNMTASKAISRLSRCSISTRCLAVRSVTQGAMASIKTVVYGGYTYRREVMSNALPALQKHAQVAADALCRRYVQPHSRNDLHGASKSHSRDASPHNPPRPKIGKFYRPRDQNSRVY